MITQIRWITIFLFFSFSTREAFSEGHEENPAKEGSSKNSLIKATKICIKKLPEGFKLDHEGASSINFGLAFPFNDTANMVGIPQVYSSTKYQNASIVAFSVIKDTLDIKKIPTSDPEGDPVKVLVEKSKDSDTTGNLYLVQHMKNNVVFLKWIAIFSDNKQTSVVSAVFREDERNILENLLLEAVSYAKLSDACK